MLISLDCSKFNFWNTKVDSSLYLLKDIEEKAKKFGPKFSYSLDTQDFLISENFIIYCHHNACRSDKNYGNIEIYTFKNNFFNEWESTPIKLPNERELDYPTCLYLKENHLFVGIAGKEYISSIFIYDITNLDNIILLKRIYLNNNPKKNPSSILFKKNQIFVVYFLDNSIEVINTSKNYNQNKRQCLLKNNYLANPLKIFQHKDEIYLNSHTSNNLFLLDKKDNEFNIIKLNIEGEKLDSPWGMCSDKKYIYISNLGLQKKQPPFINKLIKKGTNLYISKRISLDKLSGKIGSYSQIKYYENKLNF